MEIQVNENKASVEISRGITGGMVGKLNVIMMTWTKQ